MDTDAAGEPRHGRIRLPLAVAILLLAWAIRLWKLDGSDLTFDEAATYFVAHRSLPAIIAYLLQASREHPPVYYLLIHAWMGVAGISEYSLRLFSVLASLLNIALLGRLVRRLDRSFGRTGVSATGAMLLLALLPMEVYHARDARMYTLVATWALLAALFFLPLLRPAPIPPASRRRSLALLAGVNGLALFTHYYLALLILVQPVVLLLLRRWRALRDWALLHGLPGLAGLIWLSQVPGPAATLREAWGRFHPVLPTAAQLRRLLADLLFSPIRGVPWPLVYAIALLVGVGVVRLAWRRWRPALWLALTLLLPVALAYLLPEPPRSRFLTYLLPFVALALASATGLAAPRGRWEAPSDVLLPLAGLGLLLFQVWALGVYGLPRTLRWEKSRYGRTLATVRAYARPDDGVLFYGPWQWIPFQYYDPGGLPPITLLPPQAPPLLQPEEAEPVLRDLLTRYRRLWVIPAAVDDVDPRHFAAGWLNRHAHPVWKRPDLRLYLPPLPETAPTVRPALRYGEGLRLAQVAYDAPPIPAGEPLRLTFVWEVAGPVPDFQVDLTLMDERGRVWGRWPAFPGEDYHPPVQWQPGEVVVDRQGLLIPQGAPPGEYRLRLTLVERAGGAPLWPTQGTATLSDPAVDLLSITVTHPTHPPVLYGLFDSPPATFCAPDALPWLPETDCLTLAGYEPGGRRFQQGYPVLLKLHWLAPSALFTLIHWPGVEARLRVEPLLGVPGLESLALHPPAWLPSRRSSPILQEDLELPGDAETPEGRLLSQPVALELPPDAPPGPARVTLEVVGPEGEPWPLQGEKRTVVELFRFTIEGRPRLRRLPSGLTPIEADFGAQIGLRGYRIEGDARPGGVLRITYAWYALRQPEAIYAVFNHLIASDGSIAAQVDGWPQEGRLLTTQWQPGEYIEDHYTLRIPADAPPGPYTLYVGLYRADTGERLPALQAGQRLPEDRLPLPWTP